MLKVIYLKSTINKLFFFIIFFLLIKFNSIYAFENKIEFKILDKTFTTIDLNKRKNYLKFVTNNSELSKNEILEDYISAMIFYQYFINSQNKIDLKINVNKIYQDILSENKKNNNFNELNYSKNNILKNLELDLIRKSILESFLNTQINEIYKEADEIDLIYDFQIKYLNIYKKDLINNSTIVELDNFQNLEDLEKFLIENNILYSKDTKTINNINEINKVVKDKINENKYFFKISNNKMLSFFKISKNFETYNGLSATLISFKTNKKISKNDLNCEKVKNNFKDNVIIKSYKFSELNRKIKDNLINLNDYLEIINNDLITYVILCGINFDKELLNNININKKINKTVDNLEKSFINKYSIKYNLIIYNE